MEKSLKKKGNYNIGYVCIPIILLSLGIYLSSTKKPEMNKKNKCNEKGRYLLYQQHIYKTLCNGVFNSYRNIFIYKLEKCSV